ANPPFLRFEGPAGRFGSSQPWRIFMSSSGAISTKLLTLLSTLRRADSTLQRLGSPLQKELRSLSPSVIRALKIEIIGVSGRMNSRLGALLQALSDHQDRRKSSITVSTIYPSSTEPTE